MKQSQKILRLLFPPRQDAAKPVHPAVRPLHNPATSLKSRLSFNRLRFFATSADICSITKFFHQISYLLRIVTFVQTHALRFLPGRPGTNNWNTYYRRFNHFAIMTISSINRQSNRHTRCFGKQTAFNAFFGTISGVWACFFPRQAEPLSLLHPSIATPSLSLSTHHNPLNSLPTASEKLRLWSTPEIVNEPCCSNKYPLHSGRSIDNPFVAQKIFHPLLGDPARAACRHQNDEYSDVSATEARPFPITGLKSCIGSLSSFLSSMNPFKGIIAFEGIGNSKVIRIGS